MQRFVSTPAAYLAQVPIRQRGLIDAIRKVILETGSGVPEKVQYGMLGYPGVASLAAQKHYVSLYVPATALAEYREAFPGVESGKSCLRFRRIDQVDRRTLRSLLKAASVVARPSPEGFDWHSDTISRATLVNPKYRNTQNVRRFLKAQCGEHFVFDRPFMGWIKDGTEKTMGDVADEWLARQKQK